RSPLVGNHDAVRAAGNDVAGERVVRALVNDALSATEGRRAGGIGADEVALNGVVARGSLAQCDAGIGAEDDIAGDGVAARLIADVDPKGAGGGLEGRGAVLVHADVVSLNDVARAGLQ